MNKTVKTIVGVIVAIVLLAGAFSGGFIAGHILPAGAFPAIDTAFPNAQGPTTEENASTPNDVQNLFVPFWEAWNFVHKQYVDQPVDDVKLMQGAIRGMMNALGDKQTYYMEPQVFKDQTQALQGSSQYEGIGAYVDTRGDYLSIISPIQGTPADKAGLRPGDKIIKVNGEDMTGVDPNEVLQKVLGPRGTKVILTIVRENETTPLDVTITRDTIVIESATGKMLDNGIAYVDINTFGEQTTQQLRDTLDTLMAQHPKGIIIDLRNNGGGYLTTAVEVTSEFIDKGVVAYEKYGDGRREELDALGNGRATNIPLVVLINQGSASASEILAGALQDYGRAKLVGVQSYGKGSAQLWQPLSNDQGAARVTIAKWLTPKERTIDHIGLTPDVNVEVTEEDYQAGRDPQLEAAIQTLNAIVGNTAIPTSMPTSIPEPTPIPGH